MEGDVSPPQMEMASAGVPVIMWATDASTRVLAALHLAEMVVNAALFLMVTPLTSAALVDLDSLTVFA